MAFTTWKFHFLEMFFIIFTTFAIVNCLPDQGVWEAKLDQDNQYLTVSKSLYNSSEIVVKVECHSAQEIKIKVGWLLRMTECADEYVGAEKRQRTLMYYTLPRVDQFQLGYKQIETQRSIGDSMLDIDTSQDHEKTYTCSDGASIFLSYEESSRHLIQAVLPQTVDKSMETTNIQPDKSKVDPEKKVEEIHSDTQPQLQQQNTLHQRRKRSVEKKKRDNDADEKSPFSQSVSKVTDKLKDKKKQDQKVKKKKTEKNSLEKATNAVTKTWRDGIYLFILHIDPMGVTPNDFSVDVTISMKGAVGYISAIEWPLLPFYGTMCAVYVIFAAVWLLMTACNWRDLLRIQFWIGGVIILGMIEKAVFYAEYQTINSTGRSVRGAVVFAEIVSCMKRALARMLVVIVSLGFGIVKPRLGAMLHRVLGMGILYFVLGTIEGCLRVNRPKGDVSSQPLLASIPLAVLDAAICWWVFTSLVNTTRTLRLRRNIVKLSLYRHFTNVLIFAVLASIAFMVWSIKQHKLATCLTDWREIWVDDAYWHILFSIILLAIIILWRPTINNQRYAFSPLLDPAEDGDEDDDEEDTIMNDAFDGMKMRSQPNSKKKEPKSTEDDLKWIEENIPSSMADSALPAMLDSDEEIMTTKFEMSKME